MNENYEKITLEKEELTDDDLNSVSGGTRLDGGATTDGVKYVCPRCKEKTLVIYKNAQGDEVRRECSSCAERNVSLIGNDSTDNISILNRPSGRF